MNWQEVCANPHLQDLPFKIELNEWGQIVMSPASNWHGQLQIAIGVWLSKFDEKGKAISECSVTTAKGVKVADVAWASADFIKRYGFETPYPVSPEVVVEIISPANSVAEMQEKIALYLASGAQEVWLCDEQGVLSYYDTSGLLSQSIRFPGFPKQV